jgi:hypothetical protein
MMVHLQIWVSGEYTNEQFRGIVLIGRQQSTLYDIQL